MRFVTIATFGHAGADNATARGKYIKEQLTYASIPNLCHIQNKWNTSKLIWRYISHALDAIHAKIMRFVTIVTFGHAGADNATAWVKYIKGQLTHASIPNLCHIQNKWNTSKQVWRCICHALEQIHAKIMRFVTIVTFGHAGADNATTRVKYIKGRLTHGFILNLFHIQN